MKTSRRPVFADTINGHLLDLVEGRGGVDEAWIRRRTRGLLAMTAYLVVAIASASVGAALRIGPFGVLSGLELRLMGAESPILSAALGLGLFALPTVWVLRRPRDVDHPMTLGAQDAFDPTRHPRFVPSPARQLDTTRMALRLSLAIVALAVASGSLGLLIARHGGPDAGRPLATLTRAQLLAPGAHLPRFARIVGVIAQPQAAWSFDSHVRQTHYRDTYIPLTDPSWRAGDLVEVLEKDALLPDDPPTDANRFDPPGPREGAVRAGLAPWLDQAMRAAGLPLAAQVRVLERQPLHGVAPGPDWVAGFVWIDVAGSVAFVAGLMAWRLSRRLATLQDAAAPESR